MDQLMEFPKYVEKSRVLESGSSSFASSVDGFDARRHFEYRSTSSTASIICLHDVGFNHNSAMLYSNGESIDTTRYLVNAADAHMNSLTVNPLDKKLSDSSIIGFNRGWRNYYHWVAQAIPSIYFCREAIKNENSKIILPRISQWQKDSLSLIGVQDSDCLFIDENETVHLEKAYYASYLNGSTAFEVSLSSNEVFNKIRDNARTSVQSFEWVYVSRQDTNHRKMVNEEELIQLIESMGFHVVTPGNYAFADQVGLFSQARLVLGAHGAGLTNLAFCDKCSFVYEIIQSNYINPCFARIAQARGLNYTAHMFESVNTLGEPQDSFFVDLPLLRSGLEKVIRILARE